MFRHILFPVDFSARCRAVAPAVLALARKCNAKLTVLHSLDLPPGAYADWYAFSAMVDLASIKANEKQMLDEFLAGEPALERVMTDGPAVPAATRFADEHNVDLIMLPTHGYSKFRSLLLGSITSGILHDAHCPVWTAAHVEEGGIPASAEYKRVLCPVDLGEKTGALITWAGQFAAAFGAELHVAHALPGIADPAHSVSVAEYRDHLRAEAYNRYREIASLAGYHGPCEILAAGSNEKPGQVIARHADEIKADLIIAGRGVIQGTLGRLRTHVNDIIRLAPCPVISV